MLVYRLILSLVTLLGHLSIMKDLGDFVTLGKEFSLSGDELFKFARNEYDSYLKSLEREKADMAAERAAEDERAQRAYERELRLLERRVQFSDNERATAEATGGGSTRSSPHVPSFRFSAFNEKSDDLDTWFSLFEKQCNAFGVKDRDRKAHLLSLFSGQFREALLTLEADASYDVIRAHLLQTFNLTKHEYRKKILRYYSS